MTARVCAWCDQVFSILLRRVTQGEGRYCSRRCANLARRKRTPVEWGGQTFWLNPKSGYYISGRAGVFLHRAMWEKWHGPVPAGYVVHHIDGDKTNNTLTNFALMTKADHCRLHNELDPGRLGKRPRSYGLCLWPGCGEYGCSRGYCRRCYMRATRAGLIEKGPTRRPA